MSTEPQDAFADVERQVGDMLKPQEPSLPRARPFVAVMKDPVTEASQTQAQPTGWGDKSVEVEIAPPPFTPQLTVSERLTLLHERLLEVESRIDAKLELVLAVLK